MIDIPFTCVAFNLFSVMTSANVRRSEEMSGVFPPAATTQMLSRPQRGRNKHRPVSNPTQDSQRPTLYQVDASCKIAVQKELTPSMISQCIKYTFNTRTCLSPGYSNFKTG